MKYILMMEYRYSKYNTEEERDIYFKPMHYIGMFNSIEEACTTGNNILEMLEKYFPLNPHYNKKERLSKHNRLICETTYIKTPFQFFLQIKEDNEINHESFIVSTFINGTV